MKGYWLRALLGSTIGFGVSIAATANDMEHRHPMPYQVSTGNVPMVPPIDAPLVSGPPLIGDESMARPPASPMPPIGGYGAPIPMVAGPIGATPIGSLSPGYAPISPGQLAPMQLGPVPYCEEPTPVNKHCIWLRAEYLLWRVKKAEVPPLLTTGPVESVGPSGFPGVIGLPGTQILFGGESVGFELLSGGRFTIGGWCTKHPFGVEASYLCLDETTQNHSFATPSNLGSLPLSVPFFNTLAGVNDSVGIVIPGAPDLAGAVSIGLTTRLWSAEVNGLWNCSDTRRIKLSLLGGYRFLRLDEGLSFATTTTQTPTDVVLTLDEFGCRNTFHGGQLGARVEWLHGKWSLETTGKIAAGNMQRMTSVAGNLVTNDLSSTGLTQYLTGGYLEMPTDVGKHRDNKLAVAPEMTVQVGWQPCRNARFFIGYTSLYVVRVMRPSDQIEININPLQAPAFGGLPLGNPPLASQNVGRDSNFWAQGVSGGLELRY